MLQGEPASEEEAAETGLVFRRFVPPAEEHRHLVVLVHGRAGSASSMWLFSRAFSDSHVIIVAPQGTAEDELGGWSWWPILELPDGPPAASKFDEAKRAAEQLTRFIGGVQKLYRLPQGAVTAVGFSQGAGVVASCALLCPGVLKGAALLSGFIPRAVMERFEKNRIDVSFYIAHGSRDKVVPPERAYAARDFLAARGAAVTMEVDNTAHKIGPSGLKGLKEWFAGILKNSS